MLNIRMTFVQLVLVLIGVLVCVAGCGRHDAAQLPVDLKGASRVGSEDGSRRLRFVDGGQEFDAVVQRPRGSGNGWGVLMIGGGVGNDLDWTTPGFIVIDGNKTQASISGEGHADAPVLASVLADAGFVVMRWSTIAVGDPLASEWPVRSTPRTQAELLRQARLALAALRREGAIDPERVLLLGHSLGAARACTIAQEDAGVRGLILLAPAYFCRSEQIPASFASSGLLHGEEVVGSQNLPCIALFGALDASKAVDKRGMLALLGTPGYARLEVHQYEGLGHQLGPQQGHLIGPIDPIVAERVAAWAGAIASQP